MRIRATRQQSDGYLRSFTGKRLHAANPCTHRPGNPRPTVVGERAGFIACSAFWNCPFSFSLSSSWRDDAPCGGGWCWRLAQSSLTWRWSSRSSRWPCISTAPNEKRLIRAIPTFAASQPHPKISPDWPEQISPPAYQPPGEVHESLVQTAIGRLPGARMIRRHGKRPSQDHANQGEKQFDNDSARIEYARGGSRQTVICAASQGGDSMRRTLAVIAQGIQG